MSSFQKIETSRPLAIVASLAAVMALSIVSPARATEPAPAPQTTAATASSDMDAPTGTQIRVKAKNLDHVVVYAGAVHATGDAQWVDNDTSAPELPVVREPDASTR